jgi:hypothetical protein
MAGEGDLPVAFRDWVAPHFFSFLFTDSIFLFEMQYYH